MSSNPFAKARTIAGQILMWALIVVAGGGMILLIIASIVHGLSIGAPWYEVFALPLIIIGYVLVLLLAIIIYFSISTWWGSLEHRWEEKHREL